VVWRDSSCGLHWLQPQVHFLLEQCAEGQPIDGLEVIQPGGGMPQSGKPARFFIEKRMEQ